MSFDLWAKRHFGKTSEEENKICSGCNRGKIEEVRGEKMSDTILLRCCGPYSLPGDPNYGECPMLEYRKTQEDTG